MSAAQPLVELRQVTRQFREGGGLRPVLAGVDLAIYPGERVALLGRSGSGKSTLLNLLGGLDLPDSGSVLLQGVALTTLAEPLRTQLRRRAVGFVYQFFNLIPTLTVAENVALPLELNGLPDGAARVAELLARVGLAARADSFPDRLSGGEQQRVAVARALVHRPALVLADEPTGNLDGESGAQVMALLNGLVQETGGALVMVTHDRTLAEAGDRLLTLHDGQLVAT